MKYVTEKKIVYIYIYIYVCVCVCVCVCVYFVCMHVYVKREICGVMNERCN